MIIKQLNFRPFYLNEFSNSLSKTDFEENIKNCSLCKAREEALNPVPPIVVEDSNYLFIGQNPGMTEDRHNQPFWPKAPGGHILSDMLSILDLNRSLVNISNTIFCHTISNRKPSQEEIYVCSKAWKTFEFNSFYRNVKYIFLLGQEALSTSLPGYVMSAVFGTIFKISWLEKNIYFIPVWHPGHVLRMQSKKSDLYNFIAKVKQEIMKGNLE